MQKYENKIFDLVIYWCFILVVRGLIRQVVLSISGLTTDLMIPCVINIPLHIFQVVALTHALMKAKTNVFYYILLVNFGMMIELIDFDIEVEEFTDQFQDNKLYMNVLKSSILVTVIIHNQIIYNSLSECQKPNGYSDIQKYVTNTSCILITGFCICYRYRKFAEDTFSKPVWGFYATSILLLVLVIFFHHRLQMVQHTKLRHVTELQQTVTKTLEIQ